MTVPALSHARVLDRALAPSTTAARVCAALVVFPLLTALGAAVRIPLPEIGVPFTLQTLAVVLSGAYLGTLLGPLSMVAYLVYGVVGLPFFALGDGTGSLGYLLGATGGFLLAFPLASGLVGALLRRPALARHLWGRFCAFLAGSLLILACGAALAAVLGTLTLGEAFSRLFLFFAPLAVAKSVLATVADLPRAKAAG